MAKLIITHYQSKSWKRDASYENDVNTPEEISAFIDRMHFATRSIYKVLTYVQGWFLVLETETHVYSYERVD